MIEKVFSGKTVEEAVQNGLTELGITREEAQIEVLEEGKKRLFGSIPAQVKITVSPKLTDGERAVQFLAGLFDMLGQDVEPSLTEEADRIVIDLSTETTKGLIGRRGEMLDAIQTLAGAVANTGRQEYVRVVVDCGSYRDEREATLKHVAEKMAAKAVRIGKRVRLEPMNPYERRIIHAALAENPDVTTKSEGKEPARFVVIIPKNMKTFDKRNNRDRNGRGGRDNRYGKRNESRGGFEKKGYQKRELPKDDTPQTTGTSLNRGSSGAYKKGGFNGFFGTYLGNSRDGASETETPETEE